MNTQTIFWYAVGVFTLMIVGIVLTMLEYRRLDKVSSSRSNEKHRERTGER